jgi:hypothetical protein
MHIRIACSGSVRSGPQLQVLTGNLRHMQNRYSGDVGDFGKFGLLRHLVDGNEFVLGVNWYLFPDEGHNEDGKFVRYLSNPLYERCDGELHNKLKSVVSSSRSINALESANLFNCDTVYYSEQVDFYPEFPGNTRAHKDKRLFLRKEWGSNAVTTLSRANALFLDPDNGLQVSSCKNRNQKKSGKFVYFEEIRQQHADKEFTVIYHHLNRHKNHGSHSQQIQDRAAQLKSKVNPSHTVFALRYRPYSPRAFFIVAAKSAEKIISRKLKSFLHSPWGEFWDTYFEI